MNREQQEKLLLVTIKWMLNTKHKEVYVYNWVEKSILPVSRISIYAAGQRLVLTDIPGNESSLDVNLNGKDYWVTGEKVAPELLEIRNQLIAQYGNKTK